MRPNARRIEALERRRARERLPRSSGRSAAMSRRGELPEEEEAEVRALDAAIRRRMAQIRGEGYR